MPTATVNTPGKKPRNIKKVEVQKKKKETATAETDGRSVQDINSGVNASDKTKANGKERKIGDAVARLESVLKPKKQQIVKKKDAGKNGSKSMSDTTKKTLIAVVNGENDQNTLEGKLRGETSKEVTEHTKQNTPTFKDIERVTLKSMQSAFSSFETRSKEWMAQQEQSAVTVRPHTETQLLESNSIQFRTALSSIFCIRLTMENHPGQESELKILQECISVAHAMAKQQAEKIFITFGHCFDVMPKLTKELLRQCANVVDIRESICAIASPDGMSLYAVLMQTKNILKSFGKQDGAMVISSRFNCCAVALNNGGFTLVKSNGHLIYGSGWGSLNQELLSENMNGKISATLLVRRT
jgi:hypothetical protein